MYVVHSVRFGAANILKAAHIYGMAEQTATFLTEVTAIVTALVFRSSSKSCILTSNTIIVQGIKKKVGCGRIDTDW